MAEADGRVVKPRGTIELSAPEDALFSPKEIGDFIGTAFTAATNPAWGGVPLSEERLGYCRNFAQALVMRLITQDVVTGHMTYTEAVAMLLGSALAIQKLYGQGDEKR